jgi:transcriptional regulator
MVAGVGSTQLITVGSDDIPLATLLSILWEGHRHRAQGASEPAPAADPPPSASPARGRRLGGLHLPSRYASKAEHGQGVPTWNHSTVHLTGRAQIQEDGEWLPKAVDDLVERREAHRPEPWCSFGQVRWAS